MTSTLQLPPPWDVTPQRRREHLVITPQTTPPPGQRWRRPLLALADMVRARMVVLDLTHLDLGDDVVLAVCECLRGSGGAPWVPIKLVLTPGRAARIRAIPRPGGIGVYGSLDAATTP